MADNNTPYGNNEQEEELHITDDDIDRELADFDDHSTPDDIEVFEDPMADPAANMTGTTASKKGLFAKLGGMSRRRVLVILVVIIVLIYVLLKLFSASRTENFDNIQPVTQAQSSKTQSMTHNEQTLSKIAQHNTKPVMPKTVTESGDKPVTKSEAKPEVKLISNKTVQPVKPLKPKVPVLANKPTSASAASSSDSSEQSMSDANQAITPSTSAAGTTTISSNKTNPATTALVNVIKTLQANNQQLTDKLDTVNGQLQQLTQQLGALHGQVGQLGEQVTMIQQQDDSVATAQHAAPMSSVKVVPKPKHYFVEAVIPGRAWLQAPDGNTMTVTVGDEIPQLGRVTKIDVYSGDVSLSTGDMIQYGPN